MTAWLFVALGTFAGAVHAVLLHRDVQRGPFLGSWLMRMLLVGAVLLFAAHGGHLLAGAAGWASGFALVGLWVCLPGGGGHEA